MECIAMDLKVNCVDFQGKQEILYGLKKAADNVHSYSVYMQPRLMRFGENPAIKKYDKSKKGGII